MKTYLLLSLLLSAGVILSSYTYIYTKTRPVSKPVSEVIHPQWSGNSVIYEVNIRQYSKEGTFAAFEKDLPRLKSLGIDVLWLMPVHPIGIKNRKEPLGSYYSVKDYMAINPEFGTMDNFKHLVDQVHKLGMKIILDWVPNHSSCDNNLIYTHPDYYKKDANGKMISPFDWTDVLQFDYDNPELRKYMLNVMKWWIQETDIDGFRCDVAHMVPVDFWNMARMELDKIKKILFLAESEQPFLHEKAFDITYDWKFHHLMNDIAQGKKSTNNIEKHFAYVDSAYPSNAYLMQFTSNHDENSWAGTEYERMGNGAKTCAVLAATVPGIMLVYNGQEAGFNRRLKFFEKDSIDWKSNEMTPFYKKLIALRKTNHALFNGSLGGEMVRISSVRDSSTYAFIREANNDKVVVILNLSSKKQTIKLKGNQYVGSYTELFTDKQETLKPSGKFDLKPWEYRVYHQEK
ncbi:MAG TPA: alpha-amylase family glycosyl hydrolase [Bacteroidales bacterium]|nr:alpha-amylase family glycosyl hydrolase [Bacteroidales bacterium]